MVTFAQYVITEEPKSTKVMRWFLDREPLLGELTALCAGVDRPPLAAIIRYLRKEHNCKLSESSLRRYLEVLSS